MSPSAASAGAVPATSDLPDLGCTQPRIFTPPLRELTPETSLGFDVVEFAEHDLRMTLHPYQRWLFIHALELLPSGDFRFGTILILIARQNGKTLWWKILILYAMYVLGLKLVMSTAQDLDTAEETWQSVVDLVLETDEDDALVHPDFAAMVSKVVLVNGKKSLNLTTGERYKAKAATRRAGRGLSGDLVGLDELREHQTWDSWSAITHTTMARARSLIVALSNAGDATSIVLRFLRKQGHAALGDPDGINANDDPTAAPDELDIDVEDSLGIFEWSAAPGTAINDRRGWSQANPARNYPNGIPDRKIAAATREPEWVFRTEVLCQWSDGSLEGPFPAGTWDAGKVPPDVDPPQIVGPVVACIDVNIERTRAHIVVAGRNSAGAVQFEHVAARAGLDWVLPWLAERDYITAVTGQGRGAPVSGLLADLRLAGVAVVEWSGPDVPVATGTFYDAIRANQLVHLAQEALDVAAATAVPKLTDGGAFMWDRRRSPTDIAPLIAATGAVWLLGRPAEATYVSAYENAGVLVI